MCVHAGTTANPAFAAFSVVNKPADLLPLDGIHEFFVVHGSIYVPQNGIPSAYQQGDRSRGFKRVLEGVCS